MGASCEIPTWKCQQGALLSQRVTSFSCSLENLRRKKTTENCRTPLSEAKNEKRKFIRKWRWKWSRCHNSCKSKRQTLRPLSRGTLQRYSCRVINFVSIWILFFDFCIFSVCIMEYIWIWIIIVQCTSRYIYSCVQSRMLLYSIIDFVVFKNTCSSVFVTPK